MNKACKIGFLGGGKIAQAMAKGFIKAGKNYTYFGNIDITVINFNYPSSFIIIFNINCLCIAQQINHIAFLCCSIISLSMSNIAIH